MHSYAVKKQNLVLTVNGKARTAFYEYMWQYIFYVIKLNITSVL